MKTLLAVLCPVLFAVSCAPATPQARIASQPHLYERLSSREKQLVQQGTISRGMGMDAVWLAWGQPSNKFVGESANKPQERWVYTSSEPTYSTSFYGSYGYGYGPYSRFGYRSAYGLGYGPEVVYEPRVQASVTFLNRKVDSWERKR